VREHAEGLAKGELEHVSRLRSRRRAAYHAEARAAKRPVAVNDVDQLWAVALGLERASGALDQRVAEALEAVGDSTSATVLHGIARDALGMAATLASRIDGRGSQGSPAAVAASASEVLVQGNLTVLGALRLSLRNAEDVLQTYLTIAERARDEAVLREAQRLSDLATARLALISARLQAPA